LKKIIIIFAKVFFIAVVSFIVGLLFGVLPCYVLGSAWCGHKSAPPYFDLQFAIGSALALVLLSYRMFRTRRQPK
jgi:hypothetical protein